jgi:protein arginine kinase activator
MYYIHSVPVNQPAPCSACGISLMEISQTGMAGCPGCYRHFSQRLNHHVRRIHGPAVHTGRIPKSAGGQIAQKRRVSELRKTLHSAIERQEYEKCAELRDEIKLLENENNADRHNSLTPNALDSEVDTI